MHCDTAVVICVFCGCASFVPLLLSSFVLLSLSSSSLCPFYARVLLLPFLCPCPPPVLSLPCPPSNQGERMEICLRSFPPTKMLPPSTRRGTSRHNTGEVLVLGGSQYFLEYLYLKVHSQNLYFKVVLVRNCQAARYKPPWHSYSAVGGQGSVHNFVAGTKALHLLHIWPPPILKSEITEKQKSVRCVIVACKRQDVVGWRD